PRDGYGWSQPAAPVRDEGLCGDEGPPGRPGAPGAYAAGDDGYLHARPGRGPPCGRVRGLGCRHGVELPEVAADGEEPAESVQVRGVGISPGWTGQCVDSGAWVGAARS